MRSPNRARSMVSNPTPENVGKVNPDAPHEQAADYRFEDLRDLQVVEKIDAFEQNNDEGHCDASREQPENRKGNQFPEAHQVIGRDDEGRVIPEVMAGGTTVDTTEEMTMGAELGNAEIPQDHLDGEQSSGNGGR